MLKMINKNTEMCTICSYLRKTEADWMKCFTYQTNNQYLHSYPCMINCLINKIIAKKSYKNIFVK